jgi:hypothetical protein
MSKSKKILLLTLVHPDFLPPVYAVAQVLRDEGYIIDIVTFNSVVPAFFDLGENIEILQVGKYYKQTNYKKWKLRGKFITEASKKVTGDTALIISFCPFSFLTALKIQRRVSHAYIALEIENFRVKYVPMSPLSAIRNYLTFKRLNKADIIATPSLQRSAWLAGRSNLVRMPVTIHNTSYYREQSAPDKIDLTHLIPANLQGKKTFLYTGRLNENYCIKELLTAFGEFKEDAILVITGIRENDPYSGEVLELHSRLKNKARVVLLTLVTRNDLLLLQRYADVGVCFLQELDDEINTKMPAPNKVGEYIANGLYLLSTDIIYMHQFQHHEIATLVKETTHDAILSGLQNAYDEIKKPGVKDRIHEFFLTEFSMQKQMKPVLDYLISLK